MQLFAQRHHRIATICALWLGLFLLYSITAFQQVAWPIFSSPDETANYAFALQVREAGVPRIPTDYAGAPRSVTNYGTALVPVSFVFFPQLLGTVAQVVGVAGSLLFGPALAALAVIAWWHLLRVNLGKYAANVGSVVLATMPVWWFYASRSYWQQGVFTSFLILALWASVRAWRSTWWTWSVGAGLLWGVVLATRPSEVSWLVPALVTFCIVAWRALPWRRVAIAALTGLVPLLVLFSVQASTYGSADAIGYRQDGAFTPSPAAQELSTWRKAKNVFFPFGTQPGRAVEKFWTYEVLPLWYLWLPAALGCIILVRRSLRSRPAIASILAGTVGAMLCVILYGNFQFVELPAVDSVVLDHSALRYWVPLVLVMSAGWAVLYHALVRVQPVVKPLLTTLLMCTAAVSVTLGIFDHTIGLRYTLPRLRTWQEVSQWVVRTTPANAVIFAGGNDKLTFPHRRTVGYNGVVPHAGALTPAGLQTHPTYVLLLTDDQRDLFAQRFPQLMLSEAHIGPGGFELHQVFEALRTP